MSGTVLVTGATGLLGTTFCRELATDGWTVRAMRRESSTVEGLDDLDLEWCTGDVRRLADCRHAVEGCEYVVHLAGRGLGDADPETVVETNLRGTENVLESCRGEGVERLLFASTAGTRRTDGVAEESDLASPIGAYQQSKADAEAAVHDYVDDGHDAVVVHPTSVFGPDDETFTARLCALGLEPTLPAYLPGGASFVHPVDIACGMQAALTRGAPGEHYILGGENLTYREALDVIATAGDGYQPQIPAPRTAVLAAGYVADALDRYADVRMFPFTPDMARLATQELFYSSAKAMRDLDYSYRPLTDHVDEAIDWYSALGRHADADEVD
jgi:dihydroflavonol-4-reductase